MKLTTHVAFNHIPGLQRGLPNRVKDAIRKTAFDVQKDWAAGVRVDTGNLKNSIQVVAEDERSVTVGTDVEYAVFEEYGTSRMEPSYARLRAVEKHRGSHAAAVREALR